MAVTKITYENKEAIQNDASVANKSKVTDDDMNEIKKVVNNNADEVTGMQENIEDLQDGQGSANADITSLKNRVNTLESNVSNLENNKVDKIEGKSLSTEDFTTELKTKLEGLNNYDDTEIKEDISDLQEEQQTQNKNIENLQTNDSKQDLLISKLKNAALNAETEEAKSIHVEDANKFGSLEVLGNQEQETREGYSIWDYLNVAISSADGLTIEKDFEEGYITVNGTPNSNYVNLCTQEDITDMLEDGQTYTLWQEKYADSNTKGIYLQVTERTSSGKTYYFSRDNAVNFTVNKQNATYQIGLQTGTIENTGILTNYKNRYMLYKGTDTKTYELPGATPSIKYPSPVICLGSNTDGSFKGSTEIKMKNADETQEKSYTLPIQQEMLEGDYFVKEADGWKEVHGIIKTVIDGVNTKVRSLKLIANNTMIQFAADPEKVLNKNGIAVSNCFKQSKNWAVINTVVISDLGALYFHCKSDVISEITNDAMNALLQQMYEQGNPLVCYATATNSEKLTCTKEQSAVLEELNNLELFESVNNIITAEDIALLKLKYALDVETYVDNKIDEKLANINQQKAGKKL